MKLLIALPLAVLAAAGCGPRREPAPPAPPPVKEAGPPPPARIVLVEKPLAFQDQTEPVQTRIDFEFDLPRPPRRARLVMRYSGVPGALSEDYKMGRFRDRVELNDRFLLDLNTHSESADRVTEYTHWISVLMLKKHNKLSFISGTDENREDTPRIHPWELRAARLEFDW